MIPGISARCCRVASGSKESVLAGFFQFSESGAVDADLARPVLRSIVRHGLEGALAEDELA
jgi:hypothetical protein